VIGGHGQNVLEKMTMLDNYYFYFFFVFLASYIIEFYFIISVVDIHTHTQVNPNKPTRVGSGIDLEPESVFLSQGFLFNFFWCLFNPMETSLILFQLKVFIIVG